MGMGEGTSSRVEAGRNKMADPKGIATQFVTHYYQLFDSDRSQLAALYNEASTMIFEGQELTGQAAIIGKLTNLQFQECRHDLSTARLDTLVTKDQGLFILVTGVLSADGGQPLTFSETFILHQAGASWYIHNHMFRLSIA